MTRLKLSFSNSNIPRTQVPTNEQQAGNDPIRLPRFKMNKVSVLNMRRDTIAKVFIKFTVPKKDTNQTRKQLFVTAPSGTPKSVDIGVWICSEIWSKILIRSVTWHQTYNCSFRCFRCHSWLAELLGDFLFLGRSTVTNLPSSLYRYFELQGHWFDPVR